MDEDIQIALAKLGVISKEALREVGITQKKIPVVYVNYTPLLSGTYVQTTIGVNLIGYFTDKI